MLRPLDRIVPEARSPHDRTFLQRLHRYRLPSGETVVAEVALDAPTCLGSGAYVGWFLEGEKRFFFVRLDGLVIERLPGKKPGAPYAFVRRRFRAAHLEDLGEQSHCEKCDWGYAPCVHRGDGTTRSRTS